MIQHVGDRALARIVDEIGGAGAGFAHPHVERTLGAEGKTAFGLIELHRRHAQIHRDAIDLCDADFGHALGHFGKPPGMEHEPLGIGAGFGPFTAFGDGIGITVEGMHDGPAIEQRAGIAAGTEGRVDNDRTGRGIERFDHLVEQDGDMGRVRHVHAAAPFPLAFALAAVSEASARQAACAPSQPSPWA